jgi:hypothetical protein
MLAAAGATVVDRAAEEGYAMKQLLALAFLLLGVAAPLSGQAARAGQISPAARDKAPAPPPLRFHVDEEFFKLPDNIWPSEAVGVALNSKGHIFLLNRGNHPLLEFGPDGAFIRSIGDGSTIFHAAHSVRFDAEDNMWLVDAGNASSRRSAAASSLGCT